MNRLLSIGLYVGVFVSVFIFASPSHISKIVTTDFNNPIYLDGKKDFDTCVYHEEDTHSFICKNKGRTKNNINYCLAFHPLFNGIPTDGWLKCITVRNNTRKDCICVQNENFRQAEQFMNQ